MNETQAVSALGALAHTQRLRVFRALVVAGPEGLTPSVLADQLDVARNTLSFHLKELAHAGLVTRPAGERILGELERLTPDGFRRADDLGLLEPLGGSLARLPQVDLVDSPGFEAFSTYMKSSMLAISCRPRRTRRSPRRIPARSAAPPGRTPPSSTPLLPGPGPA